MEELKKCNNCKQEFPKTREFFFHAKRLLKNKSGEITSSFKVRHVCKKCHIKKTTLYRQKKREDFMLKNNLTESDMKKIKNDKRVLKTLKMPEAINLTLLQRLSLYYNIKKGYIFTNIEDFLKLYENNFFVKQKAIESRKLRGSYDIEYIKSLSSKDLQKIRYITNREEMSDSFVANRLKITTKDLTPELTAIYKKSLTIQRQLKNNGKENQNA